MLIITGMSGSGKSIVLKTLEDIGYYCVDNLPIQFLKTFALDFACAHEEPVAVAIDSRNADQFTCLPEIIENLKHSSPISILFINTNNKVLIQRYSESRRPHPLNLHMLGENRVISAIEKERELLQVIGNIADDIIDTSCLKNSDLKTYILAHYQKQKPQLEINIQSFGYKKGIPANADFIFDVRFLPNPYWDEFLRPYNGRDFQVQQWLLQYPLTQQFINETANYLCAWIPKFIAQDRAYLTIAFGCTGGQHRSVFISESIRNLLIKQFPNITINHPDMNP